MPARVARSAARDAGVARTGALALVLALGVASCGPTREVARAPGPEAAREDAPLDASTRRHPGHSDDKHLTFDEDLDGGVAPRNHTERLWGDYLDRQGRPALGWHSHHPDTGNAQ